MTLHTKAATDDILDIFNQPLRNVDPLTAPPESDGETDYDDDDYTSAGESTGTGRVSGLSESGDTQPDLRTQPLDPETGVGSVSPWSDFTASRHVPELQNKHDDTVDWTNKASGACLEATTTSLTGELDQLKEDTASSVFAQEHKAPNGNPGSEQQDIVTPVTAEQDQEDQEPRTRYIPLPPEDYEPPIRVLREPMAQAQNRLPFMTPIIEKTESSLGALTIKTEKDYFNHKTPSRYAERQEAISDIGEDSLSSPSKELVKEPRSTRLPKLDILKRGSRDAPDDVKSPIIEDRQCNPTEESIRALILDKSDRALSTFPGYHDYRPSSFGKAPEIRKYIKSLSRPKQDGKTTSSLCLPPALRFDSTPSTSYTIKRELGKGAFAPVYLAEEQHDDTSEDSHRTLLAVKCEHPPTPWEFYIMCSLHQRLSLSTKGTLHPSILDSLCKPTALHHFTDEAYLLESFLDQGTLLDLVNLARSDPTGQTTTLDESIAMFFTVELLRAVEAMHSVGILHGDLKADNCLVRLGDAPSSSSSSSSPDHPNTVPATTESRYSRHGDQGWSHRGLCLIDFGRGIDLHAFRPDVQFVADWKTGKQDCPEMREMRPWVWQVDYWGMAAIAHSLLFGKYMDDNVIAVPNTAGGNQSVAAEEEKEEDLLIDITTDPAPTSTSTSTSTSTTARNLKTHPSRPRYRPREPFKRYWQTALWTRLFDILLNPTMTADTTATTAAKAKAVADGTRIPYAAAALAAVRQDMEMWLEGEGGKRNGGLRNGLRRLEERLREGGSGKGR